MTKTILFGMPAVSEIFKEIEANLKYYGFNVVSIAELDSNFRYPSLRSRINVKFRKHILKDKDAKKDLKCDVLQKEITKRLNANNKADYALVISGDIYSHQFLQFLRGHSIHGLVNYQFDGLSRFPDIWTRISLFDRCYVFDSDDLTGKDYSLFPATNFYLDYDLTNLSEDVDFYFTGAHMDSRCKMISAFGQYAQDRGKSLECNIFWNHGTLALAKSIYPNENIRLIDQIISFSENVQRAKRAKVLLDFVISEHKGLSFRVFEALGYRKKLITTNADVLKYDFYHPNNILVWDGQDFGAIDKFLEKPYHEIDKTIREKYSFGNWINYILRIEPYTPIDLPQ
ncbi:MAG: hypothetical protein Q4A84_10835 [Neisseria sp.]|uniref:hypothetical protein n=1 Tax=Neisseria sp. TaxID=192066 RepID=UPI0026DB04AA|nr:hypothetical protein [Neisseria sp.]MDO4642174.1 hypothetical protein [Neisseria sp.]